MLVARAEANAVRRLREATSKNGIKATEYLVAIQYLNALGGLSRGLHSKVVLLPSNSVNTISNIMRYSRPSPRS